MGFLRLPTVRKPKVGSGAGGAASLMVEMGGWEAKRTSFLGEGSPTAGVKHGWSNWRKNRSEIGSQPLLGLKPNFTQKARYFVRNRVNSSGSLWGNLPS